MATASTFKTENYLEQNRVHWPTTGRHILAQYDKDCIVVYQAFCPEIADYAVQHGQFGGTRYSFTRMTWIKTNFLWMMYRSNWAQRKNQQRILAIYLTREGFDQILKFSKGTGIRVEGRTPGNVRIQWDPDHDPFGQNQRRRAVQIGIKGIPLQRFHEQYIQHIEDVTDFVKEQRQHVVKKQLDKLLTPRERVYRPSAEEICRHILLDDSQSYFNNIKEETTVTERSATESIHTTNINHNDSTESDEADCRDDASGPDPETFPPINKLITDCATGKQELIVCFGGSFNPIHNGHIQLFETALSYVKNNTNFNVVAARLVVTPDSFVEKRLKRKDDTPIKAKHRLKMCEIAYEGHGLIKTHYTTLPSAYNCGENVRKWENLQHARVAVVIGADKVVSNDGHWIWQPKSKYLTFCVGSKGITDILRKAYMEHTNEDLLSKEDFQIIETNVITFHSADIRRILRETEAEHKSGSYSTQSKHLYTLNNEGKMLGNADELTNLVAPTKERQIPANWDDVDDDLENNNDDLSQYELVEQNENTETIQQKMKHIRATDLEPLDIPLAHSNDQKRKTDEMHAVEDLVLKGYILNSVGEYVTDHYTDLFL